MRGDAEAGLRGEESLLQQVALPEHKRSGTAQGAQRLRSRRVGVPLAPFDSALLCSGLSGRAIRSYSSLLRRCGVSAPIIHAEYVPRYPRLCTTSTGMRLSLA